MVTTQTTITLPEELLREIDEAASEVNLSRADLIRAGVRRYVRSDRRWKRVQAEVSERAREYGILTEDDVEELVDSVSE